jgi:hypothetical protein
MPSQAKKFARPHLNGKKLGMVACTCHPTTGESIRQEDCGLGQPGQKKKKKKKSNTSKITRAKRAGGTTEVVEWHLPSKCEALSSNHVPPMRGTGDGTEGKKEGIRKRDCERAASET